MRARVGVLGELERLAHERLERRRAGGDHAGVDLEAVAATKLVMDGAQVVQGYVRYGRSNTYTAKNMIESLLDVLGVSTNNLFPWLTVQDHHTVRCCDLLVRIYNTGECDLVYGVGDTECHGSVQRENKRNVSKAYCLPNAQV